MTTKFSLPLVCSDTLHCLEDSLDGQTALSRSFVCRYVDMWPGRFKRIREAVSAGHSEDAIDAAPSLRSSSLMVGAARLGQLATELIQELETGCGTVGVQKLATLRNCGNQTAVHLQASCINAA